MHDQQSNQRKFRLFNVIDDYKREGIAIEAGFLLSVARLKRVLDQLLEWRSIPLVIRYDYGPELISDAFTGRAKKHDIGIDYIQHENP